MLKNLSLGYVMIFILRNYFHYQVFGTNYVFGLIMLMKLYEL